MTTIICLIAACLIAEESATRCDREPGSMVIIERPITWRDTADLLGTRLHSREQQACARIVIETPFPANHRLVTFSVERRNVRQARGQ